MEKVWHAILLQSKPEVIFLSSRSVWAHFRTQGLKTHGHLMARTLMALTPKIESHVRRRGPPGDGINEEPLGSISTMREETLGYLSKSKIHKCILKI